MVSQKKLENTVERLEEFGFAAKITEGSATFSDSGTLAVTAIEKGDEDSITAEGTTTVKIPIDKIKKISSSSYLQESITLKLESPVRQPVKAVREMRPNIIDESFASLLNMSVPSTSIIFYENEEFEVSASNSVIVDRVTGL